MNTTQIIAAVVLVAAAAGGTYYYSTSTDEGALISDSATTKKEVTSNPFSYIGKGDYTCDVSVNIASSTSTGTLWIHNTDLRGSFVSVRNGTTISSDVLKLGNTAYTWTSALKQGIVTTISEDNEKKFETEFSKMVNNSNENVTWNCSPGTDVSKLVKPSDMEFVDVNTMLKSPKLPLITQ